MHQLDMSLASSRVVGNVLRAQAEAVGDDVFLMMDDRRLSFEQVNRTVNGYAAGLRRLGVEAGDRVTLLMENSLEFAMTAFAANKLGATWVPVNTTYKGAWLSDTLADADSRLLVVDDGLFDRVAEVGAEAGVKRAVRLGSDSAGTEQGIECLPFAALETGSVAEPDAEVDDAAISAVMWTSGTTGRSKGVMQSHNAWLACAELFRQPRQIRDGDVLYCPLPMFNSGGWVFNIFHALIDGLPIGIDTHFSVQEFWNRIRHYGATQVTTLGAMHIYLWQAPPRPDDRDNPLRIAGFVPLPAELVEPMKERFGIDGIWQAYGQSECMPAVFADPARTWKPNSAGVARADLEVVTLNDRGERVPAGEVGEICIRPRKPRVIFSGYFNNPEKTLEAYEDLWYHSGDLGRIDEDGELFFVDRKADFMRHKGRNIASFEVERAALSHPGVREVAAHGVPSAELESEDEVKICVVRADGEPVTAEELAGHIMANAPYFLVPRYVEFVDELPHTPTGRVQKFKLRERGITDGTWDRDAAGFVVER